MTIKATCTCGAAFTAKARLAGKRVKCRVCGQPFTVPSADVRGGSDKIRVDCRCGSSLRAKPALAGKALNCPSCGELVVVPSRPQGVQESLHDDLFVDDSSGGDPLGLGLGTEPDANPTLDDFFADNLPQSTAFVPPLPVNSVPSQSADSEPSKEKQPLKIDGRAIAVISYLSLPGWIAAFVLHSKSDEKTSLGAFHLRQSTGLICVGFAFCVVMPLLKVIGPFAVALGGVAIALVSLAMSVHGIYGLVSAARGEEDYLISFFGDAFDGMFPWID